MNNRFLKNFRKKKYLASERALERSRSPDVSIDCVFLFLSFSFLIFDIGGAGAFFYNRKRISERLLYKSTKGECIRIIPKYYIRRLLLLLQLCRQDYKVILRQL